MPTFGYKCPGCKTDYESGDYAVGRCPTCDRVGIRSYAFNIGGGNSPGKEGEAPAPERRANATFVDCAMEGCGTGFDVGRGISIDATRMKMRRVKTPVRNRGAKVRFTDPDISA